jgi:[ribosomal protein S5]-alanine N-acetyltransferase
MYHVLWWIRPARVRGCIACDDAGVTELLIPPIPTTRYSLVSMSVPFMHCLLARDLTGAATEIGAAVPSDLPERLDGFLQFRIADLAVDPAAQPWLGRAIVASEPDGPRVIGSVGFHAPPDATGRVEVGYHVEPEYRRRGVATEAIRALFDWAVREHGISHFRAAIAPDNVASLAVVARFGFHQAGVQLDDVDGTELIFELDEWPPTA